MADVMQCAYCGRKGERGYVHPVGTPSLMVCKNRRACVRRRDGRLPRWLAGKPETHQ